MLDPRDLTEAERQLLSVLWKAELRNEPTDRKTLQALGRKDIGRRQVGWTDAYAGLVDKGLVTKKGRGYSATKEGAECQTMLFREHPYWRFLYDEFYARVEESRAHSVLCERVYGRDLCQHGMMNMAQLQGLLDALRLDKGRRVIELGCGNGRIAEYISDLTGTHITGVDLSEEGIRRAKARTKGKADRLRFLHANINDFNFKKGSFDVLIAVDTLYFIDMATVIGRARKALADGGQMGFLQSHWHQAHVSADTLHPRKTPLAEALKKYDLRFTTRDFSADEDAHWQRLLDALNDLKPAFEAEGCLPLFEFRREEAEANVLWNGTGKRVRYLYHVRT
ncbi:MAG: class I SAM-dependent methyltransferase [Planctomycetota bacterium]